MAALTSAPNQGEDTEWWRSAFQADYLERYAHRGAGEAEALIAALVPQLKDRQPVVDVGCGAGRHLTRLRAAGIAAIGLDYSADLLSKQQLVALRADMRAAPVAHGIGAALFLFTAFGYFSEAENRACLRTWFEKLRADGVVLCDVPDPEQVQLIPHSQRTLADGSQLNEIRSHAEGRVRKQIRLTRNNGDVIERSESVRLYSRQEWLDLATMLGAQIAWWPHPLLNRWLVVLTNRRI